MNEFVRAITGVTPEQDRVGTLMLSRPPTNALTRQMYREIIAAAYDSVNAPTSRRSSCSAGTRSSAPGMTFPSCAP